jgi:hypothetical protein
MYSFLERSLSAAVFNCHMESPNDHWGWVYARSWGFHVFFLLFFNCHYLSRLGVMECPNNHRRWVCRGSWAFQIYKK